ncbi:tetratricopeptide repeat-containing glycosyltransferase [Blastopirellula marina]|uniref:Cellulose synthase (UDP-forming) n=1 Tax=Blastopirellula marina DSM 3645 TaxID=314230 RepID=A3ZTV9_9BACT|nr:glycosyltransferase [Blastopirellula marina]EAQ80016.1 Cellulose synthase (UDP-forming) [Blastopirellula marina DSM 3645]
MSTFDKNSSEPRHFHHFVIVLAAIMSTVYISYRLFYTLNFESYYAIAASVTLLGAETWGVILLFLYFMQVWDSIVLDPVPPLAERTVDVFLPTYNEDVQLLRGSINALNQLDYPHRTYVLDDGRRAEVAELCQEMGVEYISRENNLHAKAGNLNHALDRTDGEFVVIFDADHIARSNFISRTLGYFADEKLAFIQTPHAFYNFDNFQSHVDYKRGIYWEEGQLFYNVIQPGKTSWNANVFCGSAAIFRRTALEEVGLIATETITEDMHTGLRIHAKGWKSLFVNERMIAAQAAPDITSFASQRLRWGEGNLSIFAYDNPLTMKGLTIGQRLNYLGSMLGWTTGPAKALLYIAPILMLFSGVSPVGHFNATLLLITLAYLIVTWTTVKLISNGYGRLWDMEVQAMTNFWIQCCCVARAMLNRGRGKFVVTSKRGRQNTKVTMLIAPHIALITLGMAAIAWAGAKIYLGASNDYIALTVGGILIAIQSLMAFQVVRKALRPGDGRFSWRHPTNEVHIRFEGDGVSGQAISTDVNETGIGAIVYMPIPVGAIVNLTLSTTARRLNCQAVVRKCWQVNSEQTNFNAFRVGFQFINATTEQLSEIWSISAETAVDGQYKRLAPRSSRAGRRKFVRLPLEIAASADSDVLAKAVSSAVFDDAIVFETNSPLSVDQEIYFRINSPVGRMSGHGRLESTGESSEYRLLFTKFDDQSRSVLKSIQHAAGGRSKLSEVISPAVDIAPRPIMLPLLEGGWMALAASLLCVICAWHIWKDNYFLSNISKSPAMLTPAERQRADTIITQLLDSPKSVKDPAILFEARKVLQMLGEKDRLAKLDAVLAIDFPHDLGLKLARASQLFDQGKTPEAYAAYKAMAVETATGEILATQEQEGDIQLGLARSAGALKETTIAIAAYRKALEIRPNPEIDFELANLLFDQHKLNEVRTLLETMAPSFDTRLIRARLDLNDGKVASALASLKMLSSERPTDNDTRRLYAEALAKSGDTNQAIAQLKILIQAGFETTTLQMRTVDLLASEGRYQETAALLNELSERADIDEQFWPTYVNAVRHLSKTTPKMNATIDRIYKRLVAEENGACALKEDLAEYLVQTGAVSKSVKLLAECVKQEPANLRIRKRYAEVLHNAGEFAAADEQYQLLLTSVKESDLMDVSAKANDNI